MNTVSKSYVHFLFPKSAQHTIPKFGTGRLAVLNSGFINRILVMEEAANDEIRLKFVEREGKRYLIIHKFIFA